MFTNVTNLQNFLKQEKIKNLDIRFIDSKFKARSISFSPNYFPFQLLRVKQFKLVGLNLLGLSLKRCYKDPFLPHPTLVFFTNLVNHHTKLLKLKADKLTTNQAVMEFYMVNREENKNIGAYDLPPPSYDLNRDFRNEVVLALESMGVTVISHCAGARLAQNIITIKATNKLSQLYAHEKFKYAVLMVAAAYNKEVKLNEGAFAQKSLLA